MSITRALFHVKRVPERREEYSGGAFNVKSGSIFYFIFSPSLQP